MHTLSYIHNVTKLLSCVNITPLPHLPHPLQRKCEKYWESELNKPFKPGRDLSVTTLRCDTHPEFELRTIKLEKVWEPTLTGFCWWPTHTKRR